MAQTRVVVLDMNGIVADIRRREACAVKNRTPDVVLPNGQKAYLHPRAGDFLRWVAGLENAVVVTYTSRLRHNAEPVEALLDLVAAGGNPKRFEPVARLYGEDCKPAGTNRNDPYHPVKTLDAVLRAVHNVHNVHKTALDDVQGQNVVFVDDHANRIESENARVVHAGRYDAAIADTENLILKTAQDLRDQLD
jgi:hypothetical protein